MAKLKFVTLQKIAALAINLSFLLQNILAPLAFLSLAKPVMAGDQPTVEVSFDESKHSFDVVAKTIQNADFTLSYQHSANPASEGLMGHLEVNDDQVGRGEFLAGTQSGEHINKHDVQSGDLQLIGVNSDGADFDLSTHFVMKNDILWVEQSGDTFTTYSVQTDRTYSAPQDEQVKLTFKSLPENPGYLQIQKLELSEEEQAELGAVGNVAYDITSDMPDGSFSYDLSLPNPAPDQEVIVQYSEDGDNFEQVDSAQADGESLAIANLDHFTVFVVTTPPQLIGDECVNVGGEDGCYTSIQAAINAVDDADADPDTILIKNGTYKLPSTLNINKQVSIIGESKAGVVIDASDNGKGYGILISSDNVTLKRVTILPPVVSGIEGKEGGGYAIHVSNTPNLIHNLTLKNITIENGNRTSFDLHGVDGGLLKNLTARNNVYGNGLSLTGSSNITVEGFKSSGNAWGGIALYNSNNTSPARATSNITLLGSTFSIAEDNSIYEENEHGLKITNISAEGFDYRVTNDVYRGAGSENFVHYQKTLTDATNFALGLQAINPNTASVIQQISTGDYYVAEGMKIQEAIDTASDGDKIQIMEGSFVEQLTIQNKEISLEGAGKDLTLVESPDTLVTTFTSSAANKAIIGIIDNANVNVKNLTVDGLQKGQGNYRLIGVGFYNAQGVIDSLRVNNIRENSNSGNQHGTGVYGYTTDNQSREIVLRNSEISNYQKNGVALSGENLRAVVENNTVVGYGEIDFIAQNGIQLSYGAYGKVTGNTVQANSFVNPGNTWDRGAAGILLYETKGALDISNNSVESNDSAIYFWDNSGSIHVNNNNLSNNFVGMIFGGLTEAVQSFAGNTFSNNSTDLMYYHEGFDLEATNNIWSSNSLDGIEEKIEHDCAHSSYSHGVCNLTDYEESFGSVIYDPWTGKVVPDSDFPTLSNIKMFVNGQESRLTKAGDSVRITADVTDDYSDIDKVEIWVREYPWDPNHNELNYGQMTLVAGDTYEFVFTVPVSYKDGDPLNEAENGNYFNFRPYDIAGNSQIGWRENFTIDNSGPVAPEILFPGKEQYFSSKPILNSWTTVSDPAGIKEYRVEYVYDYDASNPKYRTLAGTSRNHAPGNSEQGGVTIRIQAYDNLGNEGTWSDPVHYYYDTVAPNAPKLTSPENGYITRSVKFNQTWESVSDAVTYNYRSCHNDPTTESCDLKYSESFANTVKKVSAGQPDGHFWWQVQAVDAAGNQSPWSEAWKITIDNIAPEATIDSIKYPNGTLSDKFVTNLNTPVIVGTFLSDDVESATASVNGHDYSVSINSSEWEATVTDVIPDGDNELRLTVTDKAGNSKSFTKNILVDSKVPSATHTYYKNGEVITDDIAYVKDVSELTFTGEYNDQDPSVGLFWDSFVIFQAQDDRSFRFAANGKKSYCGWRSSPNLINLSGSSFSLATPAPFSDCVSSLENGEYYLAHQIFDNATRKDIPSINQFRDVLGLHFVIDNTIPTSAITAPITSTNSATFVTNDWDGSLAGTAADVGSHVTEVKLSIKRNNGDYWDKDSASWISDPGNEVLFNADGTNNWTYTLPSHDPDTYTVRSHAVDAAGNQENTAELVIIYDQTIPEVKLTINPDQADGQNNWYITQPTITLEPSDDQDPEHGVDRVEYQWDNSSNWTQYKQPIQPPSEGSHLLTYRAFDQAGNPSEEGVRTILYDASAPSQSDLSFDHNPTRKKVELFKWSAAQDNVGIVRYDISWSEKDGDRSFSKSVGSDVLETELDELREGAWTVKVKAYDSAGHSTESTTTLTVDTTAPHAPDLKLDSYVGGTVELSWDKVEDGDDYVVLW